MKKNRIFTTLLILLILSMSVVVFATGKDTTDLDRATMVANNATGEITNVKISLNGVQLNIPSEYGYPFIDNQSRTIIPLRIISERLGHQVEWDNATQTATIDGEISITIGEKVVKTPNGDIKMDTFAILKGDRTYVPLRFVVEALGYEVSYNGPNRANNYQHMVDISGQPKTPVEPEKPSVGHDLEHITINSPNSRTDFELPGHDSNLDFNIHYAPWQTDLETQYDDAERLLRARFGNNPEIDEVINYMRSDTDLTKKFWKINGQSIMVQSVHKVGGLVSVWRAE